MIRVNTKKTASSSGVFIARLVIGVLATLLLISMGTLSLWAQSVDLNVAVLVNSSDPTYYNPHSSSPGEYQRYTERYLEHLQIPYDVIDVSTTAPPIDLGSRQLILAAHRHLNLSSAWQQAIIGAVAGGTGFVNLDCDTGVGTQAHIQAIFGATQSVAGTPGNAVTIPASVMGDGSTPHFITAMQLHFPPTDPSGDLVHQFHFDATGTMDYITSTVLVGAKGTVLAKVGSDPLYLATTYKLGRAVDVGTYDYLRADRFGFMQGLDDLFWRSLVWAARKPFVVRGYPRLWAVQMDDTGTGWAYRIRDTYDTALTGTKLPDGTGGPWKVTGFVFLNYLYDPSAERSQIASDISAGLLKVGPHSIGDTTGGDLYWSSSVPLTDSQWLTNVNYVKNWMAGQAGDPIPSISRSMVPHFWDLSNNAGYDMWNSLGERYITEIQMPGAYYEAQPSKTDPDRLHLRPFRLYELPPLGSSNEDNGMYYADDLTVGSRSGLPAQKFFAFCTQLGSSRYPRPDALWPNLAGRNWSVAQSVENFTYYTWRFWSGLAPVQIFTHDIGNFQDSTVTERQSLITQVSSWLNTRGVRHVFMEDLGDYLYARTKSLLTSAHADSSTISLTFTGSSYTAEAKPITTKALVFFGDNEGLWVDVPAFQSGTTVSIPNQTPPTLAVDQPALTFAAVPGGANPASQTVSIMNSGSGTLNWTASSNAAWLAVSPTAGTNTGGITVSVNVSGLPAGTYNGSVTLQADGAINSPLSIVVTLNVVAPTLAVNPTSLAFAAVAGQPSPTPARVDITNSGGGSLNWAATSDVPWLSLSSSSGTAPSSITVSANSSSMAVGNYAGHVTITAAGASNSPQVIPVALAVSGVAGVLMSSDFNDGTLNGWIPSPLGYFQNWSVVNGVVQYNGGGHTQVYAGDSSWSDYDLEVKVKLATLSDYPGGIRGRVNGSTGAAYAVWLYPAEGIIRLYRNTGWNIDAGFATLGQAAVAFDTANFHKIRLSFKGSSIVVYYDDAPVITATDSSYGSGFVALDVSNQVISFDDVIVSGSSTVTSSAATVPSTLAFTGSATQTVQVSSSGGVLTWSAASNAPWMTVSPARGTTPASLSVAANAASLTPGTYSGEIVITAPGAVLSPLRVPVTLTLGGGTPTAWMSANFNDGTLNGWLLSPLSSMQNWSVVNGVVQYNGAGASQLYAGDASWANYDVEAKVKLASLNNYPGGIRGRVNDTTGASYALWLYPASGTIVLYRTNTWNIDSGYTALGQAAVSLDTTAFHKLRLSFNGSVISAFYDDALLITANDSTLTSGFVALDGASQPISFDDVVVTGTGTAQSALTSSPASLTFGSSSTQNVQLGSTGGTLTWSASSNAPWLTVSPASGATPTSMAVSVDASGLSAGMYAGTVSIVAPGASTTTSSLPVTLNVTSPGGQLTVSPNALAFTAVSGQAAPAGQALSIGNSGTGTLSWTASVDSPWIILSAASGVAPSQLSVSVDTTGLTAPADGGNIVIQPSDGGAPIKVPVSLQFFTQLLNENFDNGAADWVISPMGGADTWTTAPGTYKHVGMVASQSCSGDSSWTDYQFQTTLQLSSLLNYPGGVRGRVNPVTGAGYGIWLYPADGILRLYRIAQWNIDGGGLVQLAQTAVPFDTNPHVVRLDFQGSNLKVYWDGAAVMQATDSTYGNGYVCLDGSTEPVTYDSVSVIGAATATTAPSLTATPASLSFSGMVSAAAPASQTVAFASTGAALNWTVTSNSPWLLASPSSGSTPATLTASVDGSGLAAGSYNGVLSISAPGSATPLVSIPVTFNLAAPLAVTSVQLNPSTVVGGGTSTATLTLSTAAPTGGAAITITSSSGAATAPSVVTVRAGNSSATFTVSTTSVTASTAATITATYGSSSRSAVLMVSPPAVSLSSLALSPTSLIGGGKSTATVRLTAPAPSGGMVVALQSSNAAVAQVPTSVTVAAGTTTATFTVTTVAVSSNTTVSVSATNGETVSAVLTVTAAKVKSVTLSRTSVKGGTSLTGQVTLNGPAPVGGAVVELSSSNTKAATVPLQVKVAAGSTIGGFAITTYKVSAATSVLIAASYNGNASATLTVK